MRGSSWEATSRLKCVDLESELEKPGEGVQRASCDSARSRGHLCAVTRASMGEVTKEVCNGDPKSLWIEVTLQLVERGGSSVTFLVRARHDEHPRAGESP